MAEKIIVQEVTLDASCWPWRGRHRETNILDGVRRGWLVFNGRVCSAPFLSGAGVQTVEVCAATAEAAEVKS